MELLGGTLGVYVYLKMYTWYIYSVVRGSWEMWLFSPFLLILSSSLANMFVAKTLVSSFPIFSLIVGIVYQGPVIQ